MKRIVLITFLVLTILLTRFPLSYSELVSYGDSGYFSVLYATNEDGSEGGNEDGGGGNEDGGGGNEDGSSGGGNEGGDHDDGPTQAQRDAMQHAATEAIRAHDKQVEAEARAAEADSLRSSISDIESGISSENGNLNSISEQSNVNGNSVSNNLNVAEDGTKLSDATVKGYEEKTKEVNENGEIDDVKVKGDVNGDPVLVASGFENHKKIDFKYKSINNEITIKRSYRSNNSDKMISMGYGWSFNYDSRVIIGRKAGIKEYEIFSNNLAKSIEDLIPIVESKALINESNAEKSTIKLNKIKTDLNTLEAKLVQLNTVAQNAENLASQAENAAAISQAKAVESGLSQAFVHANNAQLYAQAARAAATNARNKANEALALVETARNIASEAEQTDFEIHKTALDTRARVTKLMGIAEDLRKRASEAYAEAREEEALYPLDPYPSDPSVYFGKGFIKYIDENGAPTLFKEEGSSDGTFVAYSDNGNSSNVFKKTADGFRLIKKNNDVIEFKHNKKGVCLLSTQTDSNNNTIVFETENDRVTKITDSFDRVTTLKYNSLNLLESVKDPLGRIYKYEYDNGNLITFIRPDKKTYKYEYSADHLLTRITKTNGKNYNFVYDDLKRVIKEEDHDGNSFKYEYDPENRKTVVTDRRGYKTSYYYNEFNRTEKIEYPDNSVVSYTYDERNNKTSVTDENNNTTYFEYNSKNDIIRITDPEGNTTTFDYNTENNKISEITDSQYRKTLFSYDSYGNLISITYPDNGIKYYEYTDGLISSIKDQNNNETKLKYDNYGNLAKIINPDNSEKKLSFDIIGRIVSVTDENNNKTTLKYDLDDKIIEKKAPVGAITKYKYDPVGNLVSFIDGKGSLTSYSYTNQKKVSKIVDSMGETVTFKYDSGNNLVESIFPNGTGFKQVYDSRNRLIKKISIPNGKETKYEYNMVGDLISQTDANGKTTEYGYDSLHRKVLIKDAMGFIRAFKYDSSGNRISYKNANGNTTKYNYDSMNRLISETDPLGNTTKYNYDYIGNLIKKVKPDSTEIDYVYNNRNKLSEINYPDNKMKSYRYDPVGNVIEASFGEEKEKRKYDSNNRLVKTDNVKLNKVIKYEYDILGNKIKMRLPGNRVLEYEYDSLNRLTKFKNPEKKHTYFKYDNMGRVVEISRPNRTRTIKKYNNDNFLESIINYNRYDRVLSSFVYTYDEVGNRLTMNEDGYDTNYEYDDLYRVTKVKYPAERLIELQNIPGDHFYRDNYKHNKDNKWGNYFEDRRDGRLDRYYGFYDYLSRPSENVQYQYDAEGNRLKMSDDFSTTDYKYNTGNQLISSGDEFYSYDSNGNRIEKKDKHKKVTYSYNNENLLSSVEKQHIDDKCKHNKERILVTEYYYDAFGRRTVKSDYEKFNKKQHFGWHEDGYKKKTDEKNYLYDGLEVLQEITGSRNKDIKEYYRINGLLLASKKYTYNHSWGHRYNFKYGSSRYYYNDGLESIVSITNSGGHSISQIRYDAFGNMIAGDLKDNNYTYTGKEFDSETNFLHFHFRKYDPNNGIWTTKDPIGIAGGFNLYLYVGNNPINFIDPLGLELSDILPGIWEALYEGTRGAFYSIGQAKDAMIDIAINGDPYAKTALGVAFASEAIPAFVVGGSFILESAPTFLSYSPQIQELFAGAMKGMPPLGVTINEAIRTFNIDNLFDSFNDLLGVDSEIEEDGKMKCE